MKKKTKNEALSMASSMYVMNAPYACCYAFCEHKDGGVSRGEFLSSSELDRLNFDHFDGFVQLSSNKRPIGCVTALKEGRDYAFFDGWIKQKGESCGKLKYGV